MATGRQYLASIIASAAKLQNESDDVLMAMIPELKEADDVLNGIVQYVADEKENRNA